MCAAVDLRSKKIILWSIVALCAAKKKLLTKKYKPRKPWCRPWHPKRLARPAKPVNESYNQVFTALHVDDPSAFEKCTRIPVTAFQELLTKIEPYIVRQDTQFRESISPGVRLEATLRFLAAGGSYASLRDSTKISKQSLSHIIPETCEAIYNVLREDYLKMPTTPDEWKAVAKQFEDWNFPHCVGAVDGKHIIICSPKGTCSNKYFNYKGTHSIVVMAVVNANYEFIYADVGTNGRVCDGGVWENSSLCAHLHQGTLGLPIDEHLPGSLKTLPFVFAGNDAFPLERNFMKPYPLEHQDDKQKVFSYRLSRAHRVAENAFGIMANRFRIFHGPINLHPQKVEKIVLACLALHNYLRREHETFYTPTRSMDNENVGDGTVTPGWWRKGKQLVPLEKLQRYHSYEAQAIRNQFMEFFNDEGAVPWQQLMCDNT